MTARLLILAILVPGLTTPVPGWTLAESPRARVRTASRVALAPGTFLVATRNLRDPNFAMTVVLLIDHGPDGAMGVVINRRSELNLSDALPDLDPPEVNDKAVFVGGPVSPGGIMMLVRSVEKPGESVPVIDDVWVSQDPELLERLVADESRETDFRLYAGYAGWAPHQLEGEVARGDWYVLPADADAIFSDRPSTIWRSLVPNVDNPYVTGAPGPIQPPDRRSAVC